MPWTNPTQPNVTDYASYLYGEVGIQVGCLPTNSNWIPLTLSIAVATVNQALGAVASPVNAALGTITVSPYVQAVYNLAADTLYNLAMDVPGQSYFTDKRREWKLLEPQVGVYASASDQGTSGGVLNPEQLRTLTLANLQQLKTPWGRAYLALAQAYGPALWGLT